MWTIFNPTEYNLETVVGEGPNGIHGKKYNLDAGDTVKFPDNVGEDLMNRYPFLKVLSKDAQQPKETQYAPPQDLSAVPEAAGVPTNEPRFVRHPSSDPGVVETGGFGPGDKNPLAEANAVGGIKLREALQDGKLVQLDSDGVQWYGGGVTQDTLDRHQ